MMKKIIATIIFAILTIAMIAQPPAGGPPKGDRKFNSEKVKAAYIGFVTQKLELTEVEAQQFWPLHNQMEKELKSIDKDLPELDKQQKLLDIRRVYSPKFIRIIGAERTEKFWKIQAKFLQMLRKKMEQKGEGEPNDRANRKPKKD